MSSFRGTTHIQQLVLSPLACQTTYLQSSIKTSWYGHTASGCGSIGGDSFLQLLEATCRKEQQLIIS
jgi:hypothetical protein